MPQIQANGIRLEYETYGPPHGEPILLIMGFGAQMTRWPAPFIAALVAKGYRVVIHDNRDVGLSQRFDAYGAPNIPSLLFALMSGANPPAAYRLEDMAADSVGLLAALGIPRAHLAGVSMGGMIAQTIAAHHPERTLSLSSIMSMTGNPRLPRPKHRAIIALSQRPIDPAVNLKGHIARGMAAHRVIGSPAHPVSCDELAERIRADAERSYSARGPARQLAAILASGDRRRALRRITAPTVVIHGAEDPLIPVQCGHDTAATIPGAELHVIEGMGHDLPAALTGRIVGLIDRAAARARVPA